MKKKSPEITSGPPKKVNLIPKGKKKVSKCLESLPRMKTKVSN